MKLYSGPLSLFSRKVEVALREKGLRFERVMVPFSQERGYAPKHPDVLAANPKGQVPVLLDGDLTLFDSTVILEYLEDAYPDPPLYPSAAKARAACRMLELFADEVLLADVRRLMYRSEPPPTEPRRREQQEAEGRSGEVALLVRWPELERGLAGGAWFCGAFSVADIALFMAVLFAQRLHGPTLDGCASLAAWYARAGERPSVATVIAEVAEADRTLSPDLATWSRPMEAPAPAGAEPAGRA